MRKLWGQVLATGGANIYGSAISAVVLIITARYLGPTGRGVYAAAIGWVLLFSTFGYLSLGQVIIHRVAGKPREEWLAEVVGTLLGILGVVVSLEWLIVALGYVLTAGTLFNNLSLGLLAVAFLALPFAVSTENLRSVLNALDALWVFNLAQVVGYSVNLAVVLVFVAFLDWGVLGAVIGFVASNAMIVIISAVYVLLQAPRLRPGWTVAKGLLVGSAQLHLNAVGGFLFTQASVLILNHFRPPEETGYYQLAVQLLGLLMILPAAVGTVSYGLVARKGPDGAWPEHRKLLQHTLMLCVPLVAAAYVAAPLAIAVTVGSSFVPAVPLFRFMLPALIGAALSSVMASQWIGRGLFWQVAVLSLAVGMVSVICDLVLIPAYGMVGAVTSTLVTYGISVVGNGLMALWVERRWRRLWRSTAHESAVSLGHYPHV